MAENGHNDVRFDPEEAFAQLHEMRRKFAQMPVSGERFTVPRDGLDGVDTILYRPAKPTQGSLPVLFNLHGGAWVGGDAVLMDSFCSLLADEIPAMIVNVTYKKVDVHPFPYPQTELCDAVLYFAEHADEYNIDKSKFAIGGHSAGAHIPQEPLMIKERVSSLHVKCSSIRSLISMKMEGEEAQQLCSCLQASFPGSTYASLVFTAAGKGR